MSHWLVNQNDRKIIKNFWGITNNWSCFKVKQVYLKNRLSLHKSRSTFEKGFVVLSLSVSIKFSSKVVYQLRDKSVLNI